MIAPNEKEVRALAELGGDPVLEWIGRIKSHCDSSWFDVTDDRKLHVLQGWSQAMAAILKAVEEARSNVKTRALKEATAARNAARF